MAETLKRMGHHESNQVLTIDVISPILKVIYITESAKFKFLYGNHISIVRLEKRMGLLKQIYKDIKSLIGTVLVLGLFLTLFWPEMFLYIALGMILCVIVIKLGWDVLCKSLRGKPQDKAAELGSVSTSESAALDLRANLLASVQSKNWSEANRLAERIGLDGLDYKSYEMMDLLHHWKCSYEDEDNRRYLDHYLVLIRDPARAREGYNKPYTLFIDAIEDYEFIREHKPTFKWPHWVDFCILAIQSGDLPSLEKVYVEKEVKATGIASHVAALARAYEKAGDHERARQLRLLG